jgi:chromosome segregation ATPase
MNSIRNISFYLALTIGVFACQSIKAMDAQEESRVLYQKQYDTYEKLLKTHDENVRLVRKSLEEHNQRVVQYDRDVKTLNQKISQFDEKVFALNDHQDLLDKDKQASKRSNGECKNVHLIDTLHVVLEIINGEYSEEKRMLSEQKTALDATKQRINRDAADAITKFPKIFKRRDLLAKMHTDLAETAARLHIDNSLPCPEKLTAVSLNRLQ